MLLCFCGYRNKFFSYDYCKPEKDGSLKIIDKEKRVIRLGSHEGEGLSYISTNETDLAVEVLSQFKKLADSYNAKFRAVATSAVREAVNQKDFIRLIKDQTGIDVEVIDGKTEAGLIFLGAEQALNIRNENVLCIDIGGGSTEVININKGKKVFAESLKLGAVRLTKQFFPDFNIDTESTKKCGNYIDSTLNEFLADYFDKQFEMVIGTSGTIEALASMIFAINKNKIPKSLTSKTFNHLELRKLSDSILSAKTKEDRMKLKGMEEKRADILPAGLLILLKIFEKFKIDVITISEYALREGIVFDMINSLKKNSSKFN